jgi:hypothetical protein
MIEASSRVPLALVVDGDGQVTCWAGPDLPDDGSRDITAWPGLAELLTRLDADPGDEVQGVLKAPFGDAVVTARRLARPLDGGCVLIAEAIEGDVVAAVERAHVTVIEAQDALDACRADLLRLQRLCERLLAVSPSAVVVDGNRRIRGLSAAGEKLLGVTAARVLGRPLSNVLSGVDFAERANPQRVELHGQALRVTVDAVDTDDETGDLLLFVEPD